MKQTRRRTSQRRVNADLRRVNLHLVEGIDCDEDVAHIRVNLIPPVATLELLRHLVLEKKGTRKRSR